MSTSSRIVEHHRRIFITEHTLLSLAQLLCPGYWVLNIEAVGDHTTPRYRASVHNGDDNVSAEGSTLGTALAMLIYHLLNGTVFPLGGPNMGRYTLPEDQE